MNHALARTETVCAWKVPLTFDFRVRVALIIQGHVISSWHRKTCSSLWRDLDGQIQINIHLSVSWSTTDLIDLTVSVIRFPSAVFAQGQADKRIIKMSSDSWKFIARSFKAWWSRHCPLRVCSFIALMNLSSRWCVILLSHLSEMFLLNKNSHKLLTLSRAIKWMWIAARIMYSLMQT